MKLSIIMPCYNVEDTLQRALDSVWMQSVNFDYEVIIINDCSTDSTLEICNKNKKNHKSIEILENEIKVGNAKSFYKGLNSAKGDYFCVLDGDDYYTVQDKLQKQVDFLDQDFNDEYVGVATQYIIDLGNGNVNIPARSSIKEFNYVDFLNSSSGYYHTATYMFKNIFRGNVPEFFNMDQYRGDTPRTTFHLMYSGKKIRVLDFVGSAYAFTYNGIWSSLDERSQFEYQINYLNKHRQNVATEYEKRKITEILEYNQFRLNHLTNTEKRKYDSSTIDECLCKIKEHANKFAFAEGNYVLQKVYYSEYMDSLSASLGYIRGVYFPEEIQMSSNTANIAIVIGILNPTGGGVFSEIIELIEIYSDKQVYIFVTDMNSVSKETALILKRYSNVTVVVSNSNEKIRELNLRMVEIAPFRTYYYCSHNNPYASAIMQHQHCENICLFSFDHGFLCGITHPNIEYYIAKRPVDYKLLNKKFGGKVLYIPAWDMGAKGCDNKWYEPFKNHSQLITASGAARFGKFDGAELYRYLDYVIELLFQTGGIHYHYGPIPQDAKVELKNKLQKSGISEQHFINVDWSDNIPLDMIEKSVDIFIEPFPIVTYKLTLKVLSVGIPVIAYDGSLRMSITDFIPGECLFWKNKSEFIDKLVDISADQLRSISLAEKEYYIKNHQVNTIKPYLRSNRSFVIPMAKPYTDDSLLSIVDSLRLFERSYRFVIQSKVEDSFVDSAVEGNHNRPRKWKITGFLLCCQEHGVGYTLNYSMIRLRKRLRRYEEDR